LQTGQALRVLSDEVAERVANQLDAYPEQGQKHFAELKAILDEEGSNYSQ
jgi:DNA-binding ferritin-like protein